MECIIEYRVILSSNASRGGGGVIDSLRDRTPSSSGRCQSTPTGLTVSMLKLG